MEAERKDDSEVFGIWPALVGLAAAALVIWAMFNLADGFL